jgi:nitrate reductase NapD
VRLDHFKRDKFEKPPRAGANICGVLVHVHPGRMEEVRQAVAGLPGTEVHHVTDDGRLIVTVEDTAECWASDTLAEISGVPGVITAALAYHYNDPNEMAEEESQ